MSGEKGDSEVLISSGLFDSIGLNNFLPPKYIVAHISSFHRKNDLFMLGDKISALPNSFLAQLDLSSVIASQIPKYSSLVLLSFGRNAKSQFLWIYNQLLDTPTLHKVPDAVFSLGPDKCGTGGVNVVYSGVFFSSKIFLNTNIGIVTGEWSDRESGNNDVDWNLISPGCYPNIYYPENVFDTRLEKCFRTILISSEKKIYIMNDETFQVLPLSINQTQLNALDIYSISFTSSYCNRIHVLAKDSSANQQLVSISFNEKTMEGTVELLFQFPKHISTNDEGSFLVSGQEPMNASSTVPLELRGIAVSSGKSLDLILYGNAILYSPDGGISFYPVKVDKNGTFDRVIKSNQNSVVIEDGERKKLFLMKLGLLELVEFDYPPKTGLGESRHLMFLDEVGNLLYFELEKHGLVFNSKAVLYKGLDTAIELTQGPSQV